MPTHCIDNAHFIIPLLVLGIIKSFKIYIKERNNGISLNIASFFITKGIKHLKLFVCCGDDNT